MGHYKRNLRDLEFNLFEVFGRQAVLGTGPYADVDADTAREMLHEVARLADERARRLAPRRRPQPAGLRPGDALRDACPSRSSVLPGLRRRRVLAARTSPRSSAAPPSRRQPAVGRRRDGPRRATPPSTCTAAGFSFAKVLHVLGTEDQQKLAGHMVDRQWGATMVLTEPDAGSDVGAGRTKAVQQPDGTWHITGVKRFITSASQRPVRQHRPLRAGPPRGRRPRHQGPVAVRRPEVPRRPRDRRARRAQRRLRHQRRAQDGPQGLHDLRADLRRGRRQPAVGTLLGDVHDGIAQMFKVIEHARMMVGTKAIATLSTGYLNALEYAKKRVQGADLTQMADKAAPRVTDHPPPRRPPLADAAEGVRRGPARARALHRDPAGRRRPWPQAARRAEDATELAERVNDLLLPIVKGVGSERGLGAARHRSRCRRSAAPASCRTTRSSSTSATPRSTPSTRARRRSRAWTSSSARSSGTRARRWPTSPTQIQEFAKADVGAAGSTSERELLGKALEDVQGIVGDMVGDLHAADPREGGDVANLYKVGQNTTRLLLAAGDLVVGWLLLRQAEVALSRARPAAPAAKDTDFYEGKVAAARFFARASCRRLAAERAIAEATDNALMDARRVRVLSVAGFPGDCRRVPR